jgi:hypothetical protein
VIYEPYFWRITSLSHLLLPDGRLHVGEPTQRGRKGVDHAAPAEEYDDAGKAGSDRPGGGPDQ